MKLTDTIKSIDINEDGSICIKSKMFKAGDLKNDK